MYKPKHAPASLLPVVLGLGEQTGTGKNTEPDRVFGALGMNYLPLRHFGADDFPFPQVGCVGSLEGTKI